MFGNTLRRDQQAALQGLRQSLGGSMPGGEALYEGRLQDAERNMASENDQNARNQLTMLSTPGARRQNLNMTPSGDVYYPDPGTMQRGAMARVFGDTSGSGYETPGGLGQLGDLGHAGFFQHFEDKDRMRSALPGLMAGLKGSRKGY